MADVGFVEDFAEILMGAAEATIEYAGKSCLGVAAVGRSVASGVLTYEIEPSPHQQGREAGGDVVGGVVDMGRYAAKLQVALGMVGYHRIEGVHHFISQHAWGAEYSQPEQGCNHAIAQVLGQSFEGSSTNFLG